ncbi:acyltransferase family protein [Chryseobacterium sp.]|uniref:acyltransferase family protein n=1 Tax=Chryseobacterium sp. TaxID=1871047 RepID=UPI0024E2770D|nr:acyltransferase family protein [Chryseobacterium sp.]
MNYRPEIDGLRTIAVTAVIIFHLNSYFLKGGFYGVDVFFVISGYLITSILIKSIEANKFSMLNFWIRRVKRLIPLLISVIITVLIIIPQFVFRPYFKDVLSDVFPAAFSYFNIHAYFNFGDYWGRGAENSYFLHTWSLSVEEQFYLVYPPFLLISYKYFKNFLKPLIILTTVSLFAFLFLVKANREFAFYMLPTRLWELSAGGILSCIPIKRVKDKVFRNLLPFCGLLLIAISYVFSNSAIDYYVLLPVLGTVLIIYFCSAEDILGKILSTELFTFIGRLSYSLYLWHWPVIILFKNLSFQLQYWNNFQKYICILIITFLLSCISYYFIEKKTKSYQHTPKIVFSGIVGIILLLFYFKSNLFSIYYKDKFNKTFYYLRYYDISPTQVKIKKDNPLLYNINMPDRSDSLSTAFKKDGFIVKKGNKDPEIVLIGDSHGVMWAKIIDEIAEKKNISRSFYTTNASKPFVSISNIKDQISNPYFTKEQRVEFAISMISNIKKWKPKKVILSCRWSTLDTYDRNHFVELLEFLDKEEIEVILINQPPVLHFFQDQNASQYFNYLGLKPFNGYHMVNTKDNSVAKANEYLKELQEKNVSIRIVDIYSDIYSNGKVKVTYKNDILYFDDDHLSYAGTKIHTKKLEKYILQ